MLSDCTFQKGILCTSSSHNEIAEAGKLPTLFTERYGSHGLGLATQLTGIYQTTPLVMTNSKAETQSISAPRNII